MCQTRAVTKNVQICIPTTKSDQDIECFVKDIKKKNEQDNSLSAIILFMVKWWEVKQRGHLFLKLDKRVLGNAQIQH